MFFYKSHIIISYFKSFKSINVSKKLYFYVFLYLFLRQSLMSNTSLGPILFLIYLNSRTISLIQSKLFILADDIVLVNFNNNCNKCNKIKLSKVTFAIFMIGLKINHYN